MEFKSIRGESRHVVDPAESGSNASKVANNLLVHIPGEASALYLFGYELIVTDPNQSAEAIRGAYAKEMLIVFACALGLSIFIRVLSRSTGPVIVTSVVAFVLWMIAFDIGALRIAGLTLGLQQSMWLFLAAAYTAVITAAGSYKKPR